jgi:hypothetical protein
MILRFITLTVLFIISIQLISHAGESLFPRGYFSKPVVTPYGIVVSNEQHSAIYLIRGGEIDELVSAPGAGRFLYFNKDKSKVGFKLINPHDEMQIPAVLDLRTREITKLEEPHSHAGQVSFSDDGAIAYVLDKTLIVRRGERVETYGLGVYSNVAPISPDGNKVAYKDGNDQIWIYHLDTQRRYRITDPAKGYRGALWAPTGDKLLYSTIGTDLYYYDLGVGRTVFIGEGENPDWSSRGDKIVFHVREIDFQNIQLFGSNIFLYEVDSHRIIQVTDTEDVYEMDARFTISGEEIIYHTYEDRQINIQRLDDRDAVLFKEIPVLRLDKPLAGTESPFEVAATQDTVIAGDIDWVHIHQVYDTRSDWDQGRVCCGATTIAQIFSTYKIFTPWPLYTHGRTSDYGLYISDPYSYNYITYTGYSGRWPSGGHGFLWHGGGSPSSRSVPYILNHGIFDTQRDASVSWNTVTTELDLGYSYVLCSTGLTAGHIVLAIGTYGDQNTVVVNDPYGDKNAGSYGYLYNGKHALYDWADANTGRQKVTPIAWGVRVRFDPAEMPLVLSYSPDTEDSVIAASHIKIDFSQSMDRESVENAFNIVPETDGAFTWSNYNRTVTFIPADQLAPATIYSIRIDTTAGNLFDIGLPESFEFQFSTKARERLIIEKMYPVDNQSGISTTVQFRFWFDALITRSAVMGMLYLYDSQDERIPLANLIVDEENGKGYLAFETRSPLLHNREYRVYVYGNLADIESYSLQDTVVVTFTTSAERYVEGITLDYFTDITNWQLMNSGEGSENIDTSLTRLMHTTIRKVAGTSAAKLEYVFDGDEGVVMISNSAGIKIEPAQTENFGLWVYGDMNGDLLEFHFLGNQHAEISVTADTLNYTGWKPVTIDVADIAASDELEFTGIAIRRISNGSTRGEIFFDLLQKDIVTPVQKDPDDIVLKNFRLHQNYPNPFNPSTNIRYDIPKSSHVRLTLYNVIGQHVATLVDEEHEAGVYEITFDASHLPSGLYVYRLHAGEYIETKSLMNVR